MAVFFAAFFRQRLCLRSRVAIAEDDLGAGCGEKADGRGADPARASGD
jgi:hypothetical protein